MLDKAGFFCYPVVGWFEQPAKFFELGVKMSYFDFERYIPNKLIEYKIYDIKDKSPQAICQYCGDIYDVYSSNLFYDENNIPVCRYCVQYREMAVCDFCRTAVSEEDIYYDSDNSPCCRNCIDNEGLTTCERCGVWVYEEDSYSTGEYYCICENCYYEIQEEESFIREYSYKPSLVFHNSNFEDDRAVFYGFEIETTFEYEGDAKSFVFELSDWEDYIYFKHDSSINDYGVEIVSHPITLAKLYQTDLFGLIHKALEDFSGDVDWSCGMHVHVAREKLSHNEWLGVIEFFQNFQQFIFNFSGRDISDFDRWCGFYQSRNQYYDLWNDERYYAINLSNPKTIEFRIFKAPETPEEAYANVEFLECLIYTVKSEIDFRNLDSNQQWFYFWENAKKYKHLWNKLSNINLHNKEKRVV